MKVKRYEGKNIQDVISKIKVDLGPGATILYMKDITQKRLFRKKIKKIEVVAGREETKPSLDTAKIELLQWELKELKESVKTITSKITNGHIDRPAVSPQPGGGGQPFSMVPGENADRKNTFAPVIRNMKKRLRDLDIEEEIVDLVIEEFQNKYSEKEFMNPLLFDDFISNYIQHQIAIAGPIVTGGRKVVAFVGPTGVGKTTTIAKLAAHFSLVERKRVSLLTVDTYRIAAVDQLKTYAEIIGIPVEVVFSPNEFLAALSRNQDKDLVLIDTPGGNPFDTIRMSELKKFLEQDTHIENHLLISLTTKAKELIEIFNCYSVMHIDKVIFTKLDECKTFGNILNVAAKVNQPISYVTTGQNVPDDIEVGETNRLMNLILRGRESLFQGRKLEGIRR
ncbi:MAG: 50S ribosome-binding GTPase [Candidatus Omnitrophica bacterium]|nr:50S ribosome-binding GTPase [Candidatus Omnitrophota bacterium]